MGDFFWCIYVYENKEPAPPKMVRKRTSGCLSNVKLGSWNTTVMWTFEATDWSRKKSPLHPVVLGAGGLAMFW